MSDQLNRIEQMLSQLSQDMSKVKDDLFHVKEQVDHINGDQTEHWKKLEEIESQMAAKEDLKPLAKHEDMMAMRDTLETIAVELSSVAEKKAEELAATTEDKAEAGYVVLESLYKRLEDQNEELRKAVNHGFNETGTALSGAYELIEKQIELLERMNKENAERFSQLADITRAWIYKGNLLEKELQDIKKKISGESGE